MNNLHTINSASDPKPRTDHVRTPSPTAETHEPDSPVGVGGMIRRGKEVHGGMTVSLRRRVGGIGGLSVPGFETGEGGRMGEYPTSCSQGRGLGYGSVGMSVGGIYEV
ncbi:hypothetical protein V502_07351 [Pseudogymnoascus sp. VKM F-4520 (FW-2644)]|nr:hypothetical protein V502_07351 [Pseudogymnoascus sp. VKM F-4520 (FW-2644)]